MPWHLTHLTQKVLSCTLGGARGMLGYMGTGVLSPILCPAFLDNVGKGFCEVACSWLIFNAAKLALG